MYKINGGRNMAGKRSLNSKYSFDTNYEKEYDEEKPNKKVIAIVTIIIVIVAVAIAIVISLKDDTQVDEQVNNTVQPQTAESKMIDKHQGYDVLGKIVIEKIGIEQYILDSTEDEALNNGVIKLYGGSLNNYGNFCIAGHNKEGVFSKLEEMEVGDTFKVIEPDLKETYYEINEIFSSEAEYLNCLLQDDEKVEITLITCENGSTTRLIVKAEEIINQ